MEKSIQEILHEIVLPRFGEDEKEVYTNIEKIAKRFSILSNVKNTSEKIKQQIMELNLIKRFLKI